HRRPGRHARPRHPVGRQRAVQLERQGRRRQHRAGRHLHHQRPGRQRRQRPGRQHRSDGPGAQRLGQRRRGAHRQSSRSWPGAVQPGPADPLIAESSMSFTIALSGISAATTDLNTISNNIANANSTGFKESRAEFGDFFQNAAYNLQTSTTGGGVRTQTIAQQFAQGSITNTSNPLDLAISGEGFFSVKDNGSVVYTRNGAFTTDSSGFVVTASGQRLQVYPPLAGGTTFSTGTLS